MAVKKPSGDREGQTGGGIKAAAKRSLKLLKVAGGEKPSATKTQPTPRSQSKSESNSKPESKSNARQQSQAKPKAQTKSRAGPKAKSNSNPGRAAASKPAGANKSAGAGRRRNGPNARTVDNAAHIQDVALDLFAQRSFSEVTIKDIGKATGLNTAMIYYYFRDKEDLFRGTVEIAVKRSLAAFEVLRSESDDPIELIANWMETHVEQLDLIRKFVKVSIDYANSGKRNARIDKAISDFYAHEKSILGEAIQQGIDAGRFRKRKPGPIIEFISTHLDGVMIRSYVMEDYDAPAAIRAFCQFVLEQLQREPPEFSRIKE